MQGFDLYNYPRKLELAINKLNADPLVCGQNKEAIISFSKTRLAKGSSHGRVAKVVYCMRFMAIWLGKPFSQATKDDLINVVGELESNPKSTRYAGRSSFRSQ